MRIAIVGAGASGLLTAYLLKVPTDHGDTIDVYEATSTAGGNCWTSYVSLPDGTTRFADLAVNDFNQPMYQELVTIMDTLKVPYDDLEDTACFYKTDGSLIYTLDGGYGSPAPDGYAELLTAWGVAGARIMHDPTYESVTVAQFLATEAPFASRPDFATNCILPRVNAMYFCDGVNGPGGMPVQTAFLYYYFQEGYGSGKPVERRYFINGAQSWTGALVTALNQLPNVKVIPQAGPVSVTSSGSSVTVQSGYGAAVYDRVVMACHADDAAKAIQNIDPTVAQMLGGVSYTNGIAYAHLDETLLPPRASARRTYNVLIRNPGDSLQYTMTYVINAHQADRENPRKDYSASPAYYVSVQPFRTPQSILLDPSRNNAPAQAPFQHNIGNASLRATQQQLWDATQGIQGRGGIYFTGGWTVGAGLQIECFESAKAMVRLLSVPLAAPAGAVAPPHMAWDPTRDREVYAPEYLRKLRAS